VCPPPCPVTLIFESPVSAFWFYPQGDRNKSLETGCKSSLRQDYAFLTAGNGFMRVLTNRLVVLKAPRRKKALRTGLFALTRLTQEALWATQ